MKIYKYLITGITLIVLANKAAYGRFEPQYRIATAPSVVKNTAPSAIRICALRVSFPADEAETCLLYTSDAADDLLCVDLGSRRIIKTKKTTHIIS